MDVFSPGIALGHAIGRLGCFAAGCCWGAACNLPWAVTFTNPQAKELTGVPLGEPLHPTQIYEALMNFALFGFLLWYIRRPHRDGSVIGCYLVLYSIGRFLLELLARSPNMPLVASRGAVVELNRIMFFI
jgi:phosphatidylglycerol:prolipoprotein diacylglycerol transferase